MSPRGSLHLALASAFALCACSGTREAPDAPTEPVVDPDIRLLPEDWLDVSPTTFANRLERWTNERQGFRFDEGARLVLVDALRAPGESGARSALLLAHAARDGDSQARTALLEQLELRASAPSRGELGGDIIAAAALAAHADRESVARRLGQLAVGQRPHPELDVRVECASSALQGGRDAVVPFLLRVLRAETPDQALDPPDWPRVTTLAWTKTRASEALSRRVGVPCDFRPDASWQDQMDGADALEAALVEAGALKP